jgi:glucan phosphorylase
VQSYQEADQTWSEYLEATEKPNAALAALVAPMLLQLAESSQSYLQADQRVAAATEAQKIVAEERPSVNSLSTLAFYTYFTGDFAAAEKARAEANKLAKTKGERDEIAKTLDEYKNNATQYVASKKQAEKAEKASGGKSPESLENPLSPGLGTGGLGG